MATLSTVQAEVILSLGWAKVVKELYLLRVQDITLYMSKILFFLENVGEEPQKERKKKKVAIKPVMKNN